jgi:hypothetical protein
MSTGFLVSITPMATHYFNYFIDLNRKYPEDAAFSAEYDRYFT